MVKRFAQILLLALYFSSIIFSQATDSIKIKNQELEKIKKGINQLESELKSKTQKERESLQTLENINKQNLLLNKLINNFVAEENQKSREIASTEESITKVENRTALLKEKYARYIVWIYKNRGLTLLRFLFNSDSFNQTIKRYQYLKYISQQNKETLQHLKTSKNELTNLKTKLEYEREKKELLVKKKLDEQKLLINKQSQRKELITALKKDQKMIAFEIEAKRRAEILIKNIIAQLIEKERERKAKLLEKKPSDRRNIPAYNYNSLANFALLKGNLIWPVNNGRVVRKFGENKNERLNTITLNYGVDISVKGEDEVVSVAEGIVSAIDWIPGYGSIVIITHRDEFRTVYGHVTEISVKEGEKVSAGRKIGNVNDSLEGTILHFEIWNERNYQNPEVWFANK